MVKLAEEDGRTMFVCQVDENLTLDEFDTSDAGNDDDVSIEGLGIQNIAANIFGEHECIYELRSAKEHVKLKVTREANSQSNVNVNSKFHAEIIVPAKIVNDVDTTAEILIQCPNSGELAIACGYDRVQNAIIFRFIFFFSSGNFVCLGEKQSFKPHFLFEPFDIDAHEGTTIELPCQVNSLIVQ